MHSPGNELSSNDLSQPRAALGASPRVASEHQWHRFHCERDSSGVEVDVSSGWRFFIGEREAPAGKITKASRVAEDLNYSIADFDDHGPSLDRSDDARPRVAGGHRDRVFSHERSVPDAFDSTVPDPSSSAAERARRRRSTVTQCKAGLDRLDARS